MGVYFGNTKVDGGSGGLPPGGEKDQVLTKLSNQDGDAGWKNVTGGTSNASDLVGAPKGAIMAWSGTTEDIPEGWHICDGTDGTLDLRGMFLLGASESHDVGETGGEEKHQLIVGEIPAHSHIENLAYNNKDVFYARKEGTNGTLSSYRSISQSSIVNYESSGLSYVQTGNTGGSTEHNNMPPYYTIIWIQKMVDDPEPIMTFSVKAPVGCIMIWSGSEDTIPEGWAPCDGQNGRPDLRDKFVLGAGESHAVDTEGGEEEHTLTVDEMPSHYHPIHYNRERFSKYYDTISNTGFVVDTISPGSGVGSSVNDAGGSQPHNNMPPFITKIYIIKIAPDETDGLDPNNYVTKVEFEETIGNINAVLDLINGEVI